MSLCCFNDSPVRFAVASTVTSIRRHLFLKVSTGRLPVSNKVQTDCDARVSELLGKDLFQPGIYTFREWGHLY